ncbi:MAG TPA: hypothetical protein VFT70_03170 [Nocardioides sp.]|nr:hypothetical protein [Nocardioides sp.]
MRRAELHDRLASLYAGRPVVLGPGPVVGWASWLARLDRLGCRTLVLDLPAPRTVTATDAVRLHDRLLRDLPPGTVATIERFDPDGRGVFRTSPFVASDEPILGRAVTGGRPRAFQALEDKLVAGGVWAAAGVDAAPYRVVPLDDEDALAAATRELAGPLGTVWSGDGFTGGGDYVRWVVDDHDRVSARAFFAPRCSRVRVMPFLDGVPCSIHGIVLPDGTATLRPVEIAVLRDRAARTFSHGGLGTGWDPPAADRERMRAVARRVGEHLRVAHAYRGAFGIDGVLTADGFRPTELNPRMPAGAHLLARVDPDFFALLQANLLVGLDAGVTVADVEELVPEMDAGRRSNVDVTLRPGERLASVLAARDEDLEAAPDVRS